MKSEPQLCERIFIYSLIFLCLIVTTILFLYLNHVHPYNFIDEAFHIPQVQRYCDGNFTEWDSKITTLPGLYVITAVILSPLNLCDRIFIRGINLFATFLNFYLTYCIVQEISTANPAQKWRKWMKLALAFNISFLPPLFFWHFLFYTDVVSVTTVLLMLLFHIRKQFKLAATLGLLAILIRQTNVIWLGFLTVERALNLMQSRMGKGGKKGPLNSPNHLRLLWILLRKEISNGPGSFMKFILQTCKDLAPYITVCILFLLFVIWNKGIVVGDRTAHVATIHIPQIFYFSVFCCIFSWPYMITQIKAFFNFMIEHCIVAGLLFAFITAAVHLNTLVHPYVLADNRHYVFYFWNKFMRRHNLFKYALIPIYSFTLFAMYRGFKHMRFATQLNYVLVISAVLIPQLLLEPRYFIIPYIFYRLSLRKPASWQILTESLTVLILNVLQFVIFVNKVFYWADQPGPQRISW